MTQNGCSTLALAWALTFSNLRLAGCGLPDHLPTVMLRPLLYAGVTRISTDNILCHHATDGQLPSRQPRWRRCHGLDVPLRRSKKGRHVYVHFCWNGRFKPTIDEKCSSMIRASSAGSAWLSPPSASSCETILQGHDRLRDIAPWGTTSPPTILG